MSCDKDLSKILAENIVIRTDCEDKNTKQNKMSIDISRGMSLEGFIKTTLSVVMVMLLMNLSIASSQHCCSRCVGDTTCEMFGNNRCRCVQGGAILDEIQNQTTTLPTYDEEVDVSLNGEAETAVTTPKGSGTNTRLSIIELIVCVFCIVIMKTC